MVQWSAWEEKRVEDFENGPCLALQTELNKQAECPSWLRAPTRTRTVICNFWTPFFLSLWPHLSTWACFVKPENIQVLLGILTPHTHTPSPFPRLQMNWGNIMWVWVWTLSVGQLHSLTIGLVFAAATRSAVVEPCKNIRPLFPSILFWHEPMQLQRQATKCRGWEKLSGNGSGNDIGNGNGKDDIL